MTLQDIQNPNFKHFSTQINKVVKKSGVVVVVTSYISIVTYSKPKEFDQGFKVVVKVDKNYHPKFQYTLYFNREGKQIEKKDFHKKSLK